MRLLLSGVIVMITHLLEGITGFGGAVMALPFLIQSIGLRNAVHLLGIFGWIMALYIVVRSWKSINWREFAFIAAWSVPGMILGLVIFDILPANYLCLLLGLFMIAVGIHGNFKAQMPSSSPALSSRTLPMKLLLVTGGVFQGAFGSGGPCIVIYTAKAIQDKTEFRLTLSLLWLVMNTFRLVTWSIQGELNNWQLWKMVLIIFPLMAAGLMTGDHLHRKINAGIFKIGVYSLLGISGIIMAIKNFSSIISH